MNGKRIWLVDDDPIFQTLSKKLITSAKPDYQIECFYNGKEALENIEQRIQKSEDFPDVILLDINMPELNGWQFLGEVQKHVDQFNNTALHIVSSSIDPDDLQKAEVDPIVQRFIQKPLNVVMIKNLL